MMILIISMTEMVILMLVKGETGKGDGMLSCLWGIFFSKEPFICPSYDTR